MRAFSSGDLTYIVEDFLADYLNLDSVTLNREHIILLRELYKNYGTEIKFKKFNSVRDNT